MTVSVLDVTHLRAGYGHADVVRGVSLELHEREIVTIAGTNGAGKSTLLKAVLGLLPRVEGVVRFGGVDIGGLAVEDRADLGIACVPQVANVFRTLTVAENLLLAASRPRGARSGPRPLGEILEIFPSLKPRLRQRAGTLSGGERQLLALAGALVRRPRVILLDEPTAALAPALVDAIFQLVRDLPREGAAVLLVEQRARKALAISGRGYVMDQGKVVLSGSGQELLAHPRMADLHLGAAAQD